MRYFAPVPVEPGERRFCNQVFGQLRKHLHPGMAEIYFTTDSVDLPLVVA